MKKAICVGINNYPDSMNALNGCVNDANDWSDLLTSIGFETSKILDDQATKTNVLTAFDNLVKGATTGDVVVFTYSGHGTQVLDISGDEYDSYDEALCVYDGNIIDDELRAILQNADSNAQIIIISDSCFSGTVTKALTQESAKPRFIKTDSIPSTAVLKKPFLSKEAEEGMIEILIAGCSDSEYSYDALINERWNGAMTAYSIPLIVNELTYNEFYEKLREKLPSTEYPQTPQLEGSEVNKNRKMFTEIINNGNDNQGDNQEGGGQGGSGSTGCLSSAMSILAVVFAIMVIFLIAFCG